MKTVINVWDVQWYGTNPDHNGYALKWTVYPWDPEDGADTSTILDSYLFTAREAERMFGDYEGMDEWFTPMELYRKVIPALNQ